jgi:tetratricopeptide (TPR) repeat protein
LTQPAGLAESIARHERFHALDPRNPMLLRALADLHHQAGNFDRALECYRECLVLDGGDQATQSRIASLHISRHEFTQAEAMLREVMAGGADDPVLWHNLGISLYFQRRWTDAVEALQKARDRGLRDADNLRYLTFAWHHLGDTKQALDICQQWLSATPSPKAHGYHALLLMDEGDMSEAVKAAEQSLAQDPDDDNANIVLGMWSTETQNIDDAAARFERVVRKDPDNCRGWLGLALVQLYRAQHVDSIASFKRALTFMPRHVGVIVAMGWAHFNNRDFAAAEATFRHAIGIERNFGEAHGGLASALVVQNRREEARREVAIARKLDPNGFGLVYARSVLMAMEGRREQGEEYMARALERQLRPGGPTLMDSIRVFLRDLAAKAEAEEQKGRLPPPKD